MAINLKSMAKELGISVSAVSRALSGKPGVSRKRRAEIENFARNVGFALDIRASSLRTGKRNGVTIVTPLNLTEIAIYRNSILFSACKMEFGSIRVITFSDSDNMDGIIRHSIADKSRGIIISHLRADTEQETLDVIRKNRIPVVSIDASYSGIDCIEIDRSNGTYQAARMLLLSGCKAPVFYSSADIDQPDARLNGVIKAFRSMKRDISEINIFKVKGYDFQSGYNLTERVINSQPVDGILAYSDTMAIGTLRYLHKAGIRVPEDVKVIGFDDIPVSQNLPVSLTTIAQPLGEMVSAAVQCIKDREADYDLPIVCKSFNTSLIVRETAPINKHLLRKEIFRTLK